MRRWIGAVMALQQHGFFSAPIATIARATVRSRGSISQRRFQSFGFTGIKSLDRVPNAIQKNHEEIREVSIPIGIELQAANKDQIDTRELLYSALQSQQDQTFAKIQEIEDKVQRLATKLDQLSQVTEVQMKINRVNLSYVSGKLIAAPPRNRRFRARLLEAYGYKRFSRPPWMNQSKKLYCPVIERLVPARNLIAAHIFKHEWARVAEEVMGLEDIDDPSNGMMLFSPIEHCFDRLQLCFVVDPDDQQIVCHVLDPSIRDRSLLGMARSRGNWNSSSEEEQELEDLSFEALDGKRLKFMTNHRPMLEALNFHARQARLHAISKRWIDDTWDFQDFYTDSERWEKLRVWVDQALTNS